MQIGEKKDHKRKDERRQCHQPEPFEKEDNHQLPYQFTPQRFAGEMMVMLNSVEPPAGMPRRRFLFSAYDQAHPSL